jgi:hypothetical protein
MRRSRVRFPPPAPVAPRSSASGRKVANGHEEGRRCDGAGRPLVLPLAPDGLRRRTPRPAVPPSRVLGAARRGLGRAAPPAVRDVAGHAVGAAGAAGWRAGSAMRTLVRRDPCASKRQRCGHPPWRVDRHRWLMRGPAPSMTAGPSALPDRRASPPRMRTYVRLSSSSRPTAPYYARRDKRIAAALAGLVAMATRLVAAAVLRVTGRRRTGPGRPPPRFGRHGPPRAAAAANPCGSGALRRPGRVGTALLSGRTPQNRSLSR